MCFWWVILYYIIYHNFFSKNWLLQSNPIARWHICQGSINNISFSADGVYMATGGRDGMSFTHCCPRVLFLPIIFYLPQKRKQNLGFILLIASRLPASVWLCKRTTYMWREKLLWCFIMLCLEVRYVWL